jgi:hypothetical protein
MQQTSFQFPLSALQSAEHAAVAHVHAATDIVRTIGVSLPEATATFAAECRAAADRLAAARDLASAALAELLGFARQVSDNLDCTTVPVVSPAGLPGFGQPGLDDPLPQGDLTSQAANAGIDDEQQMPVAAQPKTERRKRK